MTDEQLALAIKVLGVRPNSAPIRTERLEEHGALYAWQDVRGGGAVIVGRDGTYLFANSSIPYDRHLAEFLAGRRSDPELAT